MNFAAQFFYEVVGQLPDADGYIGGEEEDPFWQSEEERLAISMCQGVAGGAPPIEPDRLKDFGEQELFTDDEDTVEELANGEVTMKKELVNGEVKTAEVKMAEVKTGEIKTEEVRTGEVKTAEMKTAEVRTAKVKTREMKTAEVTTAEVKTAKVKTSEVKPGEVKPGEVKPAEVKPGEVKTGQVTEEPLNRDVKSEAPQLTDTLHTKKKSQAPAPEPPHELLRFEDVSAAALKIQPGIQRTPCTYSRLSKQCGVEIYLKKEQLQYTASVKERGVLYRLASLPPEQQKKGVIVATDCGFSMAAAHHAVELNIPVLVIMPVSCSAPRLRAYRDYGAMVISFGSTAADALKHARNLALENGYLCLEEDDSVTYLAGLGTVGMEIHEQVSKLDAVVVPAAGRCGTLVGIAAAIKHLNSAVTVIGVEPEGYPLLLQSIFYYSHDMYNAPNNKLFGAISSYLSTVTVEHTLNSHTFTLAKKLVDKVISVREEDLLVAMLRFQEFEHSTVDPEGAMGLAAILAGQLPELKGKRVAVVVSSANIGLDLVRQCLDRALVLDHRVSRFVVQLGDFPGDMAKLLDLLAREDVRLLDVCQRGRSDRADLFKAQVECVVETRDQVQSSQLHRILQERYPTLRWLDR